MGLIERIQADRTEKRVIGGVPWRPWDLGSPYWKFNIGGPVHPARAFFGQDQALGLPALYSCTRLLAENLASLPLKVYMSPPSSNLTVRYTGPSIFDAPSGNPDDTLYDWLYQCMTSMLLHGNAWGLINGRDGYGYPTSISWIPPEMVDVQDDTRQPWNPLRTRVYVFGRLVENWRDELFHVKAYSLAGRTEGISPLRAFAMTVTSGIEANRYGTDWYAAGGFPSGVFKNLELEVSREDAHEIRESLMDAIQGHKPLVVGRDWDYKPVSVPPSEAQFIEATQMNATQLAAVYGLPPDRVGGRRGDSLTYNTVEQSTLQVIEALRPWIVRLETAFFRLLPQNRFCRFNSDALLKTDLKTRTEIYAQQRAIGLRTVDEIRDLEDMEPLPGHAGNETIPLEVMVAMARSIRGIPNSMLSGITLEMDLAADKLEKLQKEGLAKPAAEPSAQAPDVMLGGMVGLNRAMEDLSTEDVIRFLRKAAAEGRERDRREGPSFIGPWLPSAAEDFREGMARRLAEADPVTRENLLAREPGGGPLPVHGENAASKYVGGGGAEPFDRAMYTAHRVDEMNRNLAHASERLGQARRAPAGDAREYEAEHVLTDIQEAHAALQRLTANVRKNYPAESAELDRVNAAGAMDARAKSVSPVHKVGTFSHLLQTIAYNHGHAIRHAQLLAREAGSASDNAMFSFDADHAERHLKDAQEHVRKLHQHLVDNYPDEGRWLTGIQQQLAGSGAASNGNGRAH